MQLQGNFHSFQAVAAILTKAPVDQLMNIVYILPQPGRKLFWWMINHNWYIELFQDHLMDPLSGVASFIACGELIIFGAWTKLKGHNWVHRSTKQEQFKALFFTISECESGPFWNFVGDGTIIVFLVNAANFLLEYGSQDTKHDMVQTWEYLASASRSHIEHLNFYQYICRLNHCIVHDFSLFLSILIN